MSREIAIDAPAKINLTLEIVGRRADGYHELRSVFARLPDLTDRVRVRRARALDVRISPPLDTTDDLASRAVRAVAAASGREPHAFVSIRKRIPVGAGLGGGSSDAAAVARALASLWQVNVPEHVAAGLGSDVPFFMTEAPLALVEGRGERVRPLRPVGLWIVLVPPRAPLSTPRVFAELRPDEWTAATGTSEELAARISDGTLTAAAVRRHARNDLLAAAERCDPRIAAARSLAAANGVTLHLSGTGPSLFAVADDRPEALRLARRLARAGLRAKALRLGS